jgi:endonuclease/exonuclease/phosphatase family metal-dependent hydrolase
MPSQERTLDPAIESLHAIVRDEIRPHLKEFEGIRDTQALLANPTYRRLESRLKKVLETPQVSSAASTPAAAKSRYRFVAWNIERGSQLDGQLHAFRTHPHLREADILLLTETDIGMARSANRDVARALAEELGFHYAFVPCYISLVRGSGVERYVEGDNELGLHGDAILSRYPLSRVRAVPLENGIDKFAAREKRLGTQTVILADIDIPNMPVTAASIHLDAHSTQHHRFEQMRTVLDALDTKRPVIIGGDWNTTTYDSSSALDAILGFWLRVMMGVDHVMRNHYLYPYRRFERELFELLEARGFDYKNSNVLGEPTICYDVNDPRAHGSLLEWVPTWCFPFLRWSLRNHNGRCPLKIDWFATRGLRLQNPTVLHEFREGRDVPLSDHDPVCLDVIP